MPTKALYLSNTYLFQSLAQIEAVERDDQGVVVILDQTNFYPQGGGQPTDTGTISSLNADFAVSKVIYRADGTIAHYGSFLKGEFKADDAVNLLINEDTRLFNSRNHTAGHLLDFAVEKHYPQLIGFKGYHFPEGAYVEFEGSLSEGERAELPEVIQRAVQEAIDR